MVCKVEGRKIFGVIRWVLLVLLLFCTMNLAACKGSKSSSVEGKLVDWNNKPVAGVKITASQVQQIKGYEQFETVTRSDGSFTLKGLFPSSVYVIKPWSDKWTTKEETKVDTAPQGETALLPNPLQIRQVYTKSEPVLVADIATGKVGRSAIEGKLVDWNGAPVVGVKIIAIQEQPVKGYEQFEVVTKEDGTFNFSVLLASANYVLKPISDKWDCKASVKVKSPQYHGDGVILPDPLQINQVYTKSEPVLVADIATGNIARTTVEGKLVDWNGKPVGGVKIIATQEQPVKRYEQFEVVTKEDGTFRFSEVLASYNYVLKPISDKWDCKASVKVKSPQHHGDGVILPDPLQINKAYASDGALVNDLATGDLRFQVSSNGVITDGQTKLEWVVGPDKETNYSQAEQWVAACQVAGGGWRMPTKAELAALFQAGVYEGNMGPFKASGLRVWAEPRDSSSAWTFNFMGGNEPSYNRGSSGSNRVFGVRSRPQHHGDGAILPEPLQINKAYARNGAPVNDLATGALRFEVSADGVITDGQTKLEWVVGPDKDTNYSQAEQWVASCKVAGSGWRMPTREELNTLYQDGVGEWNMDPAFKPTDWYGVWAEPRDSSSAWAFLFRDGIDFPPNRDNSNSSRVFGVRSRPRR